jgi:hypothetical protein
VLGGGPTADKLLATYSGTQSNEERGKILQDRHSFFEKAAAMGELIGEFKEQPFQ